jgi:cyanate permease
MGLGTDWLMAIAKLHAQWHERDGHQRSRLAGCNATMPIIVAAAAPAMMGIGDPAAVSGRSGRR